MACEFGGWKRPGVLRGFWAPLPGELRCTANGPPRWEGRLLSRLASTGRETPLIRTEKSLTVPTCERTSYQARV